jgi:acetyl esterase/lipase
MRASYVEGLEEISIHSRKIKMSDREIRVPSMISDQAKQVFADATPGDPWEMTAAGVKTIRDEGHEEVFTINKEIIEKYIDRLDETEISGVRVQTLTPKGYDRRNDSRAILYFFGGAYVMGSPLTDLVLTARLAHRLGLKVHSPYYRLAPEHPYPAAVDDGYAVYCALQESYEPGAIGIAGESAGGNLVLAMMLRARAEGIPLPPAAALLSPWCDLTPSGESQRQPQGFDPTLDYELHLRDSVAAYAGDIDQKDPRVSPLYADYSGGFPPTLITTGTRDLLMSDCARLSTRMRRAGVDARFHVWEGMWHVFEWWPEVPEAEASMDEIAEFLREHLAGE